MNYIKCSAAKMSTAAKTVSRAQKQMLKTVDRVTLQEMAHADRIRRRSNVMAFGLFGMVIGIYAYTIRRMGQEDFLEDDEPLTKQKL